MNNYNDLFSSRKISQNETTAISGFLYYINSKGFQKREGVVNITRTWHEINHDLDPDFGKFWYKKDDGISKKYIISSHPGTLYNKAVWFPVEEDQKAIDILTQYENDCIKDLERKIKLHKKNLESLAMQNSQSP